ncbi:hypothetical protein [Methylobacter sp. YRD-M1]|uniref:hypothetical protein n=1 Tax=Methylobacter sp. YRD-M1 TaxID=2911520 RepID=UPI00227CC542|nr:hypothetical protein [Methylobacter sp. YRD-M1]WAK02800.1 hypothetical protein LZ558_03150 [Methylobacter sp. YRD-M1]
MATLKCTLHLYIDDTVERYAEKHHIYRFKDILPEVACKLIASHPKVVFCPSRPVCIQCGTVLQKLGFTTGTKTVWGTETMGSTEWGVSLNVQALLKECEIDYGAIKRLRR